MASKNKSKVDDEFDKLKSVSSQEISRLILYIAFGILTACFTIFKSGNKCFLINAVAFSALAVLLHAAQYLSIYYISKRFIDAPKSIVPKKPFEISDILFILKTFSLFIAAVSFIIIALLDLQYNSRCL